MLLKLFFFLLQELNKSLKESLNEDLKYAI